MVLLQALGRAEAFTKHVLQLQQLRSVVGPLDEKEEEGTQVIVWTQSGHSE
jgi:hypothetical protein